MESYFTNLDGKKIGYASGESFTKRVKKSKHLLRMWNAWGIDKNIVNQLVEGGVTTIIIHECEENIDYVVSVKEFVEKGIEADFGYSSQIFLSLIHFKQVKCR
jgi:hypothetical protein